MSGPNNRFFNLINDIDIVVVITISDSFDSPTTSILELLHWLSETEPVSRLPIKRWSTVILIDFKNVKSWSNKSSDSKQCFPEFYPLSNMLVFIDDFTHLKIKAGIWINTLSLYEWLILETWMSLKSFKTENSFKWVFS